MHEAIVFKGINGHLELQLSAAVDFAQALEALKVKLMAAGDFFAEGSMVRLPSSTNLNDQQFNQLAEVLAEHGLVCEAQMPAVTDLPAEAPATAERERYEIEALVVTKTVRSGQKVVHDGSIVVIGDVNSGAQVIAGGDIIILGACRGLAHAGAFGNEAATITAGKLMAPQLRIAGYIARSPDEAAAKSDYIETARIKDGTVIIEPANK